MKQLVFYSMKFIGWVLLVLTVVSLVAALFKGFYMVTISGCCFVVSQMVLHSAVEFAEEFDIE